MFVPKQKDVINNCSLNMVTPVIFLKFKCYITYFSLSPILLFVYTPSLSKIEGLNKPYKKSAQFWLAGWITSCAKVCFVFFFSRLIFTPLQLKNNIKG
jgi:hypothetical protein